MSNLSKGSFESRLCKTLTTAALGIVCIPALSIAQDTVEAAEDDIVYLSPFEVSEQSNGYVASNTISGTRSQMPISDIPLNIQVFTKDLADDLMLTSQVDMERYNASLVNGGDDEHSNNVIQQAYNGFLFRGFIQNWSLRDGIRQYDPVDGQGIARVEIVKGPAAAFYGVTYPGGVMNVISKSAMLDTNFTDFSVTAGDYGEWRTTLDTNVATETGLGKIAVRYNGAYMESADEREHSDGKVEFNMVNATVQLSGSTTVKLTAEQAYRETPTALGYYFKDETDSAGNSLGNGASIPLQEVFTNISYDWNWAEGNMRSCDTEFYKAEITQEIGQNLTLNAYALYSDRVQIDSNGLDANGSSGAGSWDCNSNTGWINANTPSTADDYLLYQYHYIDWRNQDHALGITAVGHLDFDGMKNMITAGYHQWSETFYSYRGTVPSTTTNYVVVPIVSTSTLTRAQRFPSSDYFWNVTSGNHEENKNEYYFAALQSEMLGGRLRTTAAVNYTKLDLTAYSNWSSSVVSNHTEQTKTSPMFGVMFDISENISAFGVYSTSLFPCTTKNSFDQTLPPIEGESFEFGFKFDAFDNMLSGTVSYYMITQTGGYQRDYTADNANMVAWDNMTDAQRIAAYGTADDSYRSQITDREGQLGDYVAGEESESKGFEADLMFQPVKNWQIMASLAHNTVEISESANASNIGNIPTSGHIENQFSLVSKYSFEDGPLSGAFIGGGCQWADESFQGYYNGKARYYPSTFYLELFAGYSFKMSEKVTGTIQFNIKNVTSQADYVGWQATGSSSVIATKPYEIDTPVRASLSYRISF
jgi:outer membrane receptor protein involved in Fe transport